MALNVIQGQTKNQPAPQNNKRRVVDKNKLLHDLTPKQCLFNIIAEVQEGKTGSVVRERGREGERKARKGGRKEKEWETS